MKTLNSKISIGLALLVLLVGSNGCMTQSAIQYGMGHPENAWMDNKFDSISLRPDPDAKPHAVYYFLVPVTIPADVVTLPFQLITLYLNATISQC